MLGFIDDDIRLDSPHIAVKRCPWSIMTRCVVMNFFLIIISVIISFVVHIGLLGTDNRTILIISNVRFGFYYLVSTLLTLNIRTNIFLLFTVMSTMSSHGDLESAYLMMVTYECFSHPEHLWRQSVQVQCVLNLQLRAPLSLSLSLPLSLIHHQVWRLNVRYSSHNFSITWNSLALQVSSWQCLFTLLFLWKNYCSIYEFDYFPTAAYGVFCSVQIIIYLIHSSAESAYDSVSVCDNNVASSSSESVNNVSTEFWRGTKCALFNSLFAVYLYVTFTFAGMGIAALFVLLILVEFELHYYRPVFGRRTLLSDPNHITLHDSAFFALYFIYACQIVHWLIFLRHLSLAREQVIMVGFINDDILADAYAPLDLRSAPCLAERPSPSPSSSLMVMRMDTVLKGHLSTNLIILSLVGFPSTLMSSSFFSRGVTQWRAHFRSYPFSSLSLSFWSTREGLLIFGQMLRCGCLCGTPSSHTSCRSVEATTEYSYKISH